MNIVESENGSVAVARTCGSMKQSTRKVTYSFVERYPNLCLDKKDILLAQIEACKQLTQHATDEGDKKAIQKEIGELRIALDLMSL